MMLWCTDIATFTDFLPVKSLSWATCLCQCCAMIFQNVTVCYLHLFSLSSLPMKNILVYNIKRVTEAKTFPHASTPEHIFMLRGEGEEMKSEEELFMDKSYKSYSFILLNRIQSRCFNRVQSALQPSHSSRAGAGCIIMHYWSAACVTMHSRERLLMKGATKEKVNLFQFRGLHRATSGVVCW